MYVIVIFVYNIFLFAGTIFYSARIGVTVGALVLNCVKHFQAIYMFFAFVL